MFFAVETLAELTGDWQKIKQAAVRQSTVLA